MHGENARMRVPYGVKEARGMHLCRPEPWAGPGGGMGLEIRCAARRMLAADLRRFLFFVFFVLYKNILGSQYDCIHAYTGEYFERHACLFVVRIHPHS